MMPNLRWWLTMTAWAALCAGCGHAAPEETVSETVVPVTAEAAGLGDIRGLVHATGLVDPAPGAELIVTAPEAARILEIPKAVGDRVARGDLLVRFEIPALASAAATASAEVAKAEAGLRNAEAARTRAHDLFDRGVAARKEMEDADRALADAEAALSQARTARAAADVMAGRAVVHSSIDGIVVTRAHNPGDLVEAGATDAVLRVVDLRRLQVTAAVPLGDLMRVKLGAHARILGAEDGADQLTVVSRPAAVDAASASAPVRLAFARPGTLAVGTPVQVDIDAEAHTGVLLVRAAAIVHEGAESAVFVAADAKASRRVVETGLADGEFVEVRSGLKAGEMVIIAGQLGLPDGAAIAVAPSAK